MWKLIVGFENYNISSTGDVMNNKTGRILKTFPCNKGYLRCSLYKDGKKHTKKVHRLVAEGFVYNEFTKEQVNHIDGDKLNNHFMNLEWVTNKENCTHARDILNHKNSEGKDNPLSIKIVSMKNGVVKKVFDSINQAKQYGFNIGNISRCLKNDKGTHKGFQWKYFDKIIGIQK